MAPVENSHFVPGRDLRQLIHCIYGGGLGIESCKDMLGVILRLAEVEEVVDDFVSTILTRLLI
jgi:hypothetical protein